MTKTTVFFLVLGVFALLACQRPNTESSFLSSLSVKSGDPLYTTYASAMERATFLLDEGYELRCFDPQQPLRFFTDTGGQLSLGFRKGGQWVYRTEDYARAPEIQLSYPDLVQWVAAPFEGFEVQGFFLVQGSRAALLDLRMVNLLEDTLSVAVLPLFEHTLRPFHGWEQIDRRHVAFQHESYPDGWTIGQGIPHISDIQRTNEVELKIRVSDLLEHLGEQMDSFPMFLTPNEKHYPLRSSLDAFGTLTQHPILRKPNWYLTDLR